MSKSNASLQGLGVDAVSALGRVEQALASGAAYAAYVGLDVHRDTIAVSVAVCGRGEPEFVGEIAHKAKAVDKLVKRLSERFGGEALLFAYEAGPCGYGLYRQLVATGHACEVVAPSLIPRKPGERVKTDRRDAQALARLMRAGELTAVWVPDEEQEAIRDLTRAREDMKALELKARQRLGAFLLRHGRVYREGKNRWTQRHFRWLERQRFDNAVQQVTFEEYLEAVRHAQRRVAALVQEMGRALESWSLRPVVEALMALRGVNLVTAMTILAELGDITRFDSPRQLMAYLGVVPSEHSSGSRRHQGAITKAGNGHVRRLLIESAWAYRFPARRTAVIQRRAEQAPPGVQAIAWEAQKRLHHRYRALMQAGKHKNVTLCALARELAGFLWAIACEHAGRPHGSRAVA